MNDFTASNGIVVGPGVSMPYAVDRMALRDEEFFALREFFQAETDERFGRWRWPENPDYVVYPKEDGLFEVLHEPTGLVLTSTVTGNAPFSDEHAQAARAYLDAHPEPKPWHDAKPREIWVLTHVKDETSAFIVDGNRFESGAWSLPLDAPSITAGHRIWPEVSS